MAGFIQNTAFLAGRFFFLILLFYKFKNNLAFIVENNDDAKIIKHLFASKNVLVTRSSGLQQEGFKPNKHRRNNNDIVFGYIARFDKSKRTQSIIDIAAQLPINYKLHVAGVDIKGDQYSEQFRAIAKKKPNVQYFGYLNSKRKLSNFYNSVDTILYPTSREGLPMTLLEAAIQNRFHSIRRRRMQATGNRVWSRTLESR